MQALKPLIQHYPPVLNWKWWLTHGCVRTLVIRIITIFIMIIMVQKENEHCLCNNPILNSWSYDVIRVSRFIVALQ